MTNVKEDRKQHLLKDGANNPLKMVMTKEIGNNYNKYNIFTRKTGKINGHTLTRKQQHHWGILILTNLLDPFSYSTYIQYRKYGKNNEQKLQNITSHEYNAIFEALEEEVIQY